MGKTRLRDLKGLGPKSEQYLREVGIASPDDLAALGAVKAFIKLKKEGRTQPSLNFLYALVGALQDEHWITISRSEKHRLLTELEGFRELDEILKAEGIDTDKL